MTSTRPLWLLVNDDGVHAPGMKALAEAAAPFADYVIVAPHVERSGAGQGLSLSSPLRAEKLAPNVFAVEGTPTDCVLFALHKALNRRPDLVLSGINRGINIGQDTLYSGTVAAAMEGCIHGIPSMALSLKGRGHFDYAAYEDAIKIVRLILEHRARFTPAARAVVNINIPDAPLAKIKGFKIAGLGRRIYDSTIIESVDPRGRPYYWIGGGGDQFVDIPDSDCNLLCDNWITVTALEPNHVDEVANQALQESLASKLDAALAQLR